MHGVEAASQLAAVLGAEHVLGGLRGTFSWVVAPGQIRSISASTRSLRLLSSSPNLMTVGAASSAIDKTSVKAEIPSDIHKALWEKFLLVTAFGVITLALLLSSAAANAQNDDTRDLPSPSAAGRSSPPPESDMPRERARTDHLRAHAPGLQAGGCWIDGPCRKERR